MSNFHEPKREYLKINRVCDRYDIGKTWIYAAVKDGRFPAPKRFGNNSRWSLKDLLKWEAENDLDDTLPSPETLPDNQPVQRGEARC